MTQLRKQTGFTLIELMVSIFIFVLIVAIGLTNVFDFQPFYERSDAKQLVEGLVKRARAIALESGGRGILSVSNGGRVISIGIDFAPFSNPPVQDSVLLSKTLPNNITMSLGRAMVFSSDGFLLNGGNLVSSFRFNLRYYSSPYCTGTVYSTAAMTYKC